MLSLLKWANQDESHSSGRELLEALAEPTDNRTMQARPGLPWEQILRQIWPPEVTPMSWPPPRPIVGEAELEALELRFSRPGAEDSDSRKR